MKKLILAAVLLIGSISFQQAEAQISVNLGVNIGSQPDWGPVGYDHVENYYLPDINAYYSVPTHQYVYYQNNAWVRTTTLPARFRNYDFYNSHKVVINERDPWLRNKVYKAKYVNYRGKRDQVVIRDSKDEKYRNHWNNGNNKHDNGNHKGWDKHGNNKHGDDKHGNKDNDRH